MDSRHVVGRHQMSWQTGRWRRLTVT